MPRTLVALALLLASAPACAQSSPPPAPSNPLPMPFMRAGDPFTLPATDTAKSYQVHQPTGSTSYRAINPCQFADVRIKTVAANGPITTTPTAYPSVSLVTSPTDSVTSNTGTRFMARFGETLGSIPSLTGQDRIISIITVPIPGSATNIAGMVCPFEIGYGAGS